MAKLTPDQARNVERVETVIRIAQPALNLMLAVGERVSRIAESDDPEYYPARVDSVEDAHPVAKGTPARD